MTTPDAPDRSPDPDGPGGPRLARRALLRGLVAAPALGLAGCGEGATRDRPRSISGSLLGQDRARGHALRDGALHAASRGDARRESVSVAILGGGPAGLTAAWRLRRRGVEDVRVYELEDHAGGTSASGRSDVTPYPWGAHYLPVPSAAQPELRELLDEMGAWERGEDGHARPAERLLVRAPEERVFYRGFWTRGLFPEVGASPEDLAQRRRFEAEVARWVRFRDAEGRRAFTLPSRECSSAPEVLALDEVSAEAWCDRLGLTSPLVRWWLEYGTRDDYGLTLSSASAWALLFYHCARVSEPDEESADFLTWPEGNGALVEALSRGLGERLRLGHVAVRARSLGERAEVSLYDARADRGVLVSADHVIAALPRFVAARVVEGAPPAGDARYGAWLVANLHLDRRPAGRGFPPCWDNVLFDSPSLGYVCATHQRGRDDGPTVWTYYWPLTDDDPAVARRRLEDTDGATWREAILRDLERAHPDIRARTVRIDVWRWAHAMIQPRVGARSSPARGRARRPVGRVHFAHSDLSGLALFEEAFDHGLRAADEVLAARAAL